MALSSIWYKKIKNRKEKENNNNKMKNICTYKTVAKVESKVFFTEMNNNDTNYRNWQVNWKKWTEKKKGNTLYIKAFLIFKIRE